MAQAYNPHALSQAPVEAYRKQRSQALAAALQTPQVPAYEPAEASPAGSPILAKVMRTGAALYGLQRAGIDDPRQRALTAAATWIGG